MASLASNVKVFVATPADMCRSIFGESETFIKGEEMKMRLQILKYVKLKIYLKNIH